MIENEALKKVLRIYGETTSPVSQEFYQRLLLRAEKVIDSLQYEISQLKGEKSIPESWWKDCPKLAQRTMERTIQRNEKLIGFNDNLRESIIELEKEIEKLLWTG